MAHSRESQQGYDYATAPQLNSYLSLFYSYPAQANITKYWTQRNETNLSPQCDDNESTYGPLAGNNNMCEPKHPRIGDKYQAIIPSLQLQAVIPSFEDECVWESNRVSPQQIDEYLKIVQFVIGTSTTSVYTDCHYDEEKALYLLKLHNYNIRCTISTLTLQKPDKDNANYSWLFSKKKLNHNPREEKNDEEDIASDDEDEDEYEYEYEYNPNATMSMIQLNHSSQSNYNINEYDHYDDEDYCFSCGDGGNLLICDNSECRKVWHIHCVGLTKMPEEDEWFCPSHFCSICHCESSKKYTCAYCGTAFCSKHCPSECNVYEYCDVEFLCQMCLSRDDKGEWFMWRLLELHKRKKNHILKKKGKKPYKGNDLIPTHCKIGRSDIEWFHLYAAVIRIGGLSKIRDLSSWDTVRKGCALNKNFESENVWKSLRDTYIEYLYCYEKQYYPLTNHVLPRGIQSIVDNKGALDGLEENGNDDEDEDDDDEDDAMMIDSN